MAKNNLYTLSYFRKRLFENDIKSIRLVDKYFPEETRRWTILMYPNDKNVLCTCYKDNNEFWFVLQTKTQSNYIIRTKSMNIIIDAVSTLYMPETEQSQIDKPEDK